MRIGVAGLTDAAAFGHHALEVHTFLNPRTLAAIDGAPTSVGDLSTTGAVVLAGQGRTAAHIGYAAASAEVGIRAITAIENAPTPVVDGAAFHAVIFTAQGIAIAAADVGHPAPPQV